MYIHMCTCSVSKTSARAAAASFSSRMLPTKIFQVLKFCGGAFICVGFHSSTLRA